MRYRAAPRGVVTPIGRMLSARAAPVRRVRVLHAGILIIWRCVVVSRGPLGRELRSCSLRHFSGAQKIHAEQLSLKRDASLRARAVAAGAARGASAAETFERKAQLRSDVRVQRARLAAARERGAQRLASFAGRAAGSLITARGSPGRAAGRAGGHWLFLPSSPR